MVVSDIFYVHPNLGKIPILTNIFQMGLVQPSTRNVFVYTSLVHTIDRIMAAISYGAGAQTAHGAVSELGPF